MLIDDLDVISKYCHNIICLNIYKGMVGEAIEVFQVKEELLKFLQRDELDFGKCYLKKMCLPTLDQVEDKLYDLRDNCEFLKLNIESEFLIFRAGPFVIDGVDLGRFDISIPITSIGSVNPYIDSIYADPVEPAYDCSKEYFHPHIDMGDKHICLGLGENAIMKAMQEIRLLDVVEMINSILSTYNPESPYREIKYWQGSFFNCGDCDEEIEENQGEYCNLCNYSFCDHCICSGCKSTCYICSDINKCVECGAHICSECKNTCNLKCCNICDNCIITHEDDGEKNEPG